MPWVFIAVKFNCQKIATKMANPPTTSPSGDGIVGIVDVEETSYAERFIGCRDSFPPWRSVAGTRSSVM